MSSRNDYCNIYVCSVVGKTVKNNIEEDIFLLYKHFFFNGENFYCTKKTKVVKITIKKTRTF